MAALKRNVKRRRHTTSKESLRKSGDPTMECHDEELLPGIPDALTVSEICPKLSWIELNSLTTVSHGWLRAIQTREIFEARRFCGTEQTASVFQVNARKFAMYSEKDDTFYFLPEIPGLRPDTTFDSFTYASTNGRLYVMGSLKEEDSCESTSIPGELALKRTVFMYVYDLAGHIGWKKCALPTFDIQPTISAFLNGKLFVYSGTLSASYRQHLAELKCAIYDPDGDDWSLVKRRTKFDQLKILTEMDVDLPCGGFWELADLSWYGFWEVNLIFPYFEDFCSMMWEKLKCFRYFHPRYQRSRRIRRVGKFSVPVPAFCSVPLSDLQDCTAIDRWRGIAVTILDGRFLKITQHGIDVYDSRTNTWIPFSEFWDSVMTSAHRQILNALDRRDYRFGHKGRDFFSEEIHV